MTFVKPSLILMATAPFLTWSFTFSHLNMKKKIAIKNNEGNLIPSRLFSQAQVGGLENSEEKIMKKLDDISHKLKLEVFDLEEGLYGFESKDNSFGIEVIRVEIATKPSLGLELTEVARGSDGRGLVLISGKSGNALQADVQIGDIITGVSVTDKKFRERTIGVDYDLTVDAIKKASELGTKTISLELNRLVKRATIKVIVDDPKRDDEKKEITALSGENLRRLLLRKGFELYEPKTKRFDMPYATGDCAGEGLCGTCLVRIVDGGDGLSPKDDVEGLITRGRPLSWRASCRTVVGANNEESVLKIELCPQSKFDDEINPGVKSVN